VTGLRGSLRVSPQKFGLLPEHQARTGTETDEKTEPETQTQASQPPYMASVALLFPVEAATLFPMAQSIAGRDDLNLWRHGNAIVLAILILFIAFFIGVLRYFATQDRDNGKPARKEIGIAIISFLLWAGASGGYWLEKGGVNSPIPLQLGSPVFAFLTIMWVALVPYAVRQAPKATRHRKR